MNKLHCFFFLLLFFLTGSELAQNPPMDKLLFGVAYYDEYMPYDGLHKDIQMMKDAGINVVRIAESTWGTEKKAYHTAGPAGIKVIYKLKRLPDIL